MTIIFWIKQVRKLMISPTISIHLVVVFLHCDFWLKGSLIYRCSHRDHDARVVGALLGRQRHVGHAERGAVREHDGVEAVREQPAEPCARTGPRATPPRGRARARQRFGVSV